jgi:hypothetical protein
MVGTLRNYCEQTMKIRLASDLYRKTSWVLVTAESSVKQKRETVKDLTV